jgi:uncharacterized membrane protein YhaH (DUF805 family)
MNPVGVSALATFFFRPAGRIARREYALGVGLIVAVNLAVFTFLVARDALAPPVLIVVAALGLPVLVAQLVLVAKRCHDIALPGSFVLLVFVPLLGFAWLVALAIIPGTPGPNAYGPAPRFAADAAGQA